MTPRTAWCAGMLAAIDSRPSHVHRTWIIVTVAAVLTFGGCKGTSGHERGNTATDTRAASTSSTGVTSHKLVPDTSAHDTAPYKPRPLPKLTPVR